MLYDQTLEISASTTIDNLKNLLEDILDEVTVVAKEADHATLCSFNTENPVSIITNLKIFNKSGPLPNFNIFSSENVIVSISNGIDRVETIEYISNGLYKVMYTPRISGTYESSVKLGRHNLWVDLSSGITIFPFEPNVLLSTHSSDLIGTEGVEERFVVQTVDRFGNKLLSNIPKFEIIPNFSIVPDKCGGMENTNLVPLPIKIVTQNNGKRTVSFTPTIAGLNKLSIMLLVTYYRNVDFTGAILGNSNHLYSPYDEISWYQRQFTCDSTELSSGILFDWGFGSPMPHLPSFPMDSFSAKWQGEIRSPSSEFYTFYLKVDGGGRLTIGSTVLIDSIPDASSESISGSIELDTNILYSLTLEYVHGLIGLLYHLCGCQTQFL